MGGAPAVWWNDDYGRRLRIDIDTSAVARGAAEVPVYIRLSDTVIDVSRVAIAAADLRFVDATQQVVFKHEVTSWQDGVGGEVWVQLASVDDAHDHLWLYYDNAGASDIATAVFDAAYQMVHHFESEVGGVSSDAVGTLHATLVGNAAVAQGIFGNGVSLAAVGDFVTMPDDPALSPLDGEVRTLSLWLQTTSAVEPVWIKEAGCRGWSLRTADAAGLFADLRTSTDACSVHTTYSAHASGATVTDGAWHHVAWTVDRQQNEMTVFIDGQIRGTGVVGDTELAERGTPHLGRNPFEPASGFIGSFDELWMSNVARSEAWFTLVYQNGMGTLLTFGLDESRN
jgi:hypothetical protein